MPSSRTRDSWGLARRTAGVASVLLAGVLLWAYGVLFVEGGSMEPALHAGDVLVFRRSSAGLCGGDLVVFEHRDALVVHRVVATLTDGTIRTQGDANRSVDAEPVTQGAVRGEVVAVVPVGCWADGVVGSAD